MSRTAIPKSRLSSEERRASIVRTACELFAEKGFRGTTTRELAARVGVTEPVLYEHFKTKRELYSAIIEDKAQQKQSSFDALADEFSESQDDRRFFQSLGNQIMDWYTSDPAFVRLLLFSSLEGHELKDLFHARITTCFHFVEHYIARRMSEGGMRKGDPTLAARAFFGMIAHYALTGMVFGFAPLPKSAQEVVSEMVSIFLNGMCPEGIKQ